MRLFSTDCRYGTPSPELGKRSSPSLLALTLALATAGATMGVQPALAAVDDNWVGSAIGRMQSEQAQEPGQRRRHRGSDEDAADSGDDGVRPQRSTPLKRKGARRDRSGSQVASLGRDVAPAQLRPLSVIEWARPKFEAVLTPKEVASPPKEVGPMLASLGREFVATPPPGGPSLTGDRIKWMPLASVDCLAAPLRGVLTELTAAFGPMTVRWTCRDKQLNARVGGARRSYHLTGNAVDFNMTGNYRAILAFLKAKKEVGGLKHYGGGAFHIDTGPRRTW
jgi:hypothetical protein